ncbi:MAG: hypothetical protein AB7O26_02410 [Planctomycetaceae bacterium]
MKAQPTEFYADLDRDMNSATANSDADILGLVFQTGILDDKRSSPRVRVQVSVPVVPVDASGRPVGEPFVAESRNISATGICLMYKHRVTARYVLVELPGPKQERQQVAVEIIRSTVVDDGFEFAGPFVTLG